MVTAFYHDNERIVLIYRDNSIERYQKPIWGKYEYCIIDLPEKWSLPLSKKVLDDLEIEMKIKVNKIISKLKFRFSFSFNDELNENELNALIKSQINYQAARHVDFTECIQSLFENYNLQSGDTDLLEIIISDWIDSPKTRDVLIEKIEKNIGFPSELFNNSRIKISLIKIELQLACIFG